MYKRTAKFWEYSEGWLKGKKSGIANPWGYKKELLAYMAYYYGKREGIEVTFNKVGNVGKIVSIVADVNVFNRAIHYFNSRYHKVMK